MMCVNNGNEQLLNQLAEQHEQHGYHTASSVLLQSYRKYAYLHQLASQSTEGGLIILFVTSSQTTHCSCQ